jgi:xanthine dehydrogenase molybdopterin-binding subunit B
MKEGGNDMTAETGIGAAVTRKEDGRFLTGKGRYTDDIDHHGQTHAYFLRSPHAHATINGIDSAAASASDGVVAIYTSAEATAEEVGGLICGWVITDKNGEPHKNPAHPVLAISKVRYVGDPVAVVIAETAAQAKDAAEKNRGRLRRPAGQHQPGDDARRRRAATPRRCTRQLVLRLGTRRWGGGRGGLRLGGARDQARHRQ